MSGSDLPFSSPLDRIPSGRFLLTAAWGEQRRGLIVEWVQRCGGSPPMLMVAMRKGQLLSPVVRDSRHFVLHAFRPEDRLLERLFAAGAAADSDPFFGLPLRHGASGAPIVQRALWFAECEMVRHLDVDTDCELYIGLVRNAEAIEGVSAAKRPQLPSAVASKPRRRGDPESERPAAAPSPPAAAPRRRKSPKAK